MAGRRRFNALRELGWTQIPVNILLKDATETDIRVIAVNENLQRNELEDVEKGFAILSIFESNGYTGQQAIYGTKVIDNYYAKNPKAKQYDVKNLVLHIRENINSRPSAARDNFIPDENFVQTCRHIALTPKYQYQLLQIVVQLDPDVLVEAQKMGLSIKKKSLLTNSRLLDHPEIQKGLIKEIGSMDDEEAAYEVRQKINDLETGYIKPAGGGLLAQWRTKGKDS